jgi:hypothetical protein
LYLQQLQTAVFSLVIAQELLLSTLSKNFSAPKSPQNSALLENSSAYEMYWRKYGKIETKTNHLVISINSFFEGFGRWLLFFGLPLVKIFRCGASSFCFFNEICPG